MQDPPSPVPFRKALAFWAKLGCISFGGPAAQIALMHREIVVERGWISEARFSHALGYCMVLPGPEAQQLATYIGWLMHRTAGGIAAGLLFVLPSLLVLIALSAVYVFHGHTPVVAGVFYGVKPAVSAIVAHAAFRLGSRTLKNGGLRALAVAAFLALFFGHVPFPVVIALAALVGLVGGRFAPSIFSPPTAGHGAETRTPRPAPLAWRPLAKAAVIGLLMWATPMIALALAFGLTHTLTQMSWFFTKAALLTFGGAYAVLPYVQQGAVGQFGWLSAGQMIDGLALGETTPGPLIMVVTFVGFLGGAQGALFGPDGLFLAGLVAACVVTYFTFLPSFVFILLGAPLIEHTQSHARFGAPLTAISAAVVGVIAQLAVLFALHTFLPAGQLDVTALAIAGAAAVALFVFKRHVIEVIAASALIGLAVH